LITLERKPHAMCSVHAVISHARPYAIAYTLCHTHIGERDRQTERVKQI